MGVKNLILTLAENVKLLFVYVTSNVEYYVSYLLCACEDKEKRPQV